MSGAVNQVWAVFGAGSMTRADTRDETLQRREAGVLDSSDTELARQAARGDHAAFHELVDRHGKALFRSAISLAPTRADAEDLVQETFASAYKSLPAFDGRSSIRTWLTRILIRRAADAWRAGRNRRQNVSLELAEPATARRASVDQRLDLAAMLERLEPSHREVIVLREMQGLSYAEIAEHLNVPQGTVESRLHRARAELRRRLTGYSTDR